MALARPSHPPEAAGARTGGGRPHRKTRHRTRARCRAEGSRRARKGDRRKTESRHRGASVGITDLVLQSGVTADQAENLRMIKLSSDSLLSLLTGVLDFSKMDAGKFAL